MNETRRDFLKRAVGLLALPFAGALAAMEPKAAAVPTLEEELAARMAGHPHIFISTKWHSDDWFHQEWQGINRASRRWAGPGGQWS